MSTITVTTTADNGNGSLRNAIAIAKSGDTIQFSKGLTGKTIALRSGQLTLDKNLTIDGGGAPGLTVSGNNASRVFYLDRQKQATIKNLTIANGKTQGAGGGIDTRHESVLTLENVKVNNNTSELGGGLRVGHLAKATIVNSSFKGNNGTLTNKYAGSSAGAISHSESRGQLIIKGTTFENNKGFNGGAIYSFSGVTFTVEDSIFKNNTAIKEGGGAIFTDGVSSKGYNSGFADDGKIIIRGSQFDGNTAKGEGGALFLWGYTQKGGYKNDRAIIEDSVFTNNVITTSERGKASGGAIFAHMGLDIRNVTFAKNTAGKQGGALWTESSLPINISNSTFSGNQVLQDAGGAMFLNNGSTPVNITNSTIAYNKAGRANGALWFNGSHNVTLKNSIVAFNTATDRRQDQVGYQAKDGGGNLEFATSSQALRVTKNSLVANPLLGALTLVNGDLVHPLKSGSPAVNAGVSQGAPTTDQRGIQRDSKIDIGAFELVASAPNPLKVNMPSPLKALVPTVSPSFSAAMPKQTVTAPATTSIVTLRADPVAYLSLNDGKGKLAKDGSAKGRNNSGALVGDASWTKGVRGGAIAFDGKGDAVKLKNSSDINRGTHGERTVSLWFKADSVGDNQRQVLYEEGAGTRGLNIYIDDDRLYVGGWNTPGKESGWSGTWLSTDQISADKWHHVDLVLDGGREVTQNAFRGYLDGQQFGSGAGSQLWDHAGGIGLGSINGGTRFHDGITPNSGSGFAGVVDEVMVFNDALSSSEVKAFF
ncbi:MAG: hypothetical protein DCF15_09790 [Phormidesmis priestleyi]|uniref:LamG-like jellyroll fold domain-containing protein n=1 Tax=Phormidesmis priestleyi TaxID=268141 RepID=A0A2W4XII0_9CYAN|nr:MAG: hypothetical protein DCF15_09790 [Phormidesmis priestleyi]